MDKATAVKVWSSPKGAAIWEYVLKKQSKCTVKIKIYIFAFRILFVKDFWTVWWFINVTLYRLSMPYNCLDKKKFSYIVLGFFVYTEYLCRPSEASTRYCVILGDYPPQDWQSLPCAGEEFAVCWALPCAGKMHLKMRVGGTWNFTCSAEIWSIRHETREGRDEWGWGEEKGQRRKGRGGRGEREGGRGEVEGKRDKRGSRDSEGESGERKERRWEISSGKQCKKWKCRN